MAIDTNIERMYHAGKIDIPNAADHLSDISTKLYKHLQSFNEQAALAGDPSIMRSMLAVGGDLYDVLRGGVVSANNCAAAVVSAADLYVETDDQARSDYGRMDQDILDAPMPTDASQPPELKDPEGEGADVPGEDGKQDHVPSTGTPEDTSADKEQREQNEDASEYDNEREKRRG